MSSTKTSENETSLGAAEQKSSKDILNELFGSFNSTFDEDSVFIENKANSKKKKKSKKAKKSKDKDDQQEDESTRSESLSPAKKAHKKHRKESLDNGDLVKNNKEKKKRKRSPGGEDEDVDELIHKHRKNVRNQFKGLVSNIGDIVIKNDELIKSKSKKREEDIRKAAGGSVDVEDGEIMEDERKEKKHKKSKLSASQAYKLDMEEKLLLGMEANSHHSSSRNKSPKDHNKQHHSKPRSESNHKPESDRRSSADERSSSSSFKENSHHHRDRRKSGGEYEASPGPRVIRQAPPRTPPQPPQSEQSTHDHERRPNDYRDNYKVWQKERDHYENESQSYSRRRDRDYDIGNLYEKETNRRSDGISGFGFVSRSYYDDPVAQGSGSGSGGRGSHHNEHDRRRGRSRSPVSRSRSFRRSRSRSPPKWRRSRSRSSERRRRHPDDIIDKAKLLEIARKNASKLMRRGVMPSDIFSRDQIVAIRAGGKSVDELTDYCKRIARKDARGDALSEDSDGDNEFIHHPFHVKDRPLPQITLNIRNAIPIPVRTPMELAIEGAKLKTVFPVSSGCQHRIKELEWHPVNPEEEEKKAKAAEAASKSLVPLDGANVANSNDATSSKVEESKTESCTTVALIDNSKSKASTNTNKNTTRDIQLNEPKPPAFDISDVIAIRLKAMRQISENPKSIEAQKQLNDATQMMKTWADAKALEPKFLSQSELTQGPQAWAKRDQLTKAKEVQSPMGLHLLQKMGWRPGEGLGKFKGGDIEPLALEVKTDKKGLTSVLDYKKGPAMPLVFDLGGKHPISALMEICAKRKWGSPDFDLVFEHGPPHKKQFVYKVVVNGVEYQPCIAVNNKKLAKANAAAFCLQSLGLLPTSAAPESNETLQTVSPNPVPAPPYNAMTSDANSTPIGRFTPSSHYLQTVPVEPAILKIQPPLPAELMPPPPPPPPLKLIKK